VAELVEQALSARLLTVVSRPDADGQVNCTPRCCRTTHLIWTERRIVACAPTLQAEQEQARCLAAARLTGLLSSPGRARA
jgi:hypothetical protein